MNKIKFQYIIFGLIISVVLVVSSCSTRKAGFTNKVYHNTAAHYNVWWNGNESLKEAVKTLDKTVKDDYTQILPVYRLGTKQDALKTAPQLDRALEKGAKGISKHSININGKEHINYISYCYLLMVKAQFYKQEYSTAAFTSQYLISQFKNTKQAYEGMIWYARSMTHMKEYISAETILDKVNADIENGKVSSDIEKLFYLAYAECALAQGKYKIAVDYLKVAVEEVRNKAIKQRLYYILGQIYYEQEKLNTAFKYYELSAKGNSDYQMLFNARINMALSVTNKGGRNEGVLKTLHNMLKDKKNEEYSDQIYYAIGEVYMTSKDADKAVENWVESVAVSNNNQPQKIKSALRLGDTYADLLGDYVNAYSYYDTVVSILSDEDKNYNQIKNRHSILKSLAENIQIVNRADSLLAWSEMSIEERDKRIEEIITQLKIEEEKAREAELVQMIKESVKEQTNTLKGNWYFYNANTVRQGKEAFTKLWGFRTLQDNWFMTNSQSIMLNMGTSEVANAGVDLENEEKKDQDTTAAAVAAGSADDKYSPAYYLKDVPKTQEQKDTLHHEIAKASLLLGFIFNEGISNQEKALESFLRIAEDYQETEYALPTFYQLYLIYDKQGNTPNANYYKTLILKGFPDSDYANLIRNKDFYQEILDRDKAAEREYSLIYKQFLDGNYDDVIALSESAKEKYTDKEMIPKYMYWQALALWKNGDKDTVIRIFEEIITSYPESEIIPLVKSQLESFKSGTADYLANRTEDKLKPSGDVNTVSESSSNEGKAEQEKKDEKLAPESELYRFRENIAHYVIVILNDNKINGTQLSYGVSDFNQEYFSTNGLKTSVLLFSQDIEMINVERFPNAKKAMEYYEFIQQKEGPLNKLKKEDYKVFAVSTQNYMMFYNQKNIPAYEEFFKKFYF